MQEIKDNLEKFAYASEKAATEFAEVPDFADVAAKWCDYCVHNLRGDLLRLGLNIAHSLSEFDRGLKHPETLND